MKSKKGFTLIELLAVIVILAIIALIATPIIIGVIEQARKKAFENTAYGVLEGLRLNYTERILTGTTSEEQEFTFPNSGLKLSGEEPAYGSAKIDGKGNISFALADKDKKWCVKKDATSEKVTILDYNVETCKIDETGGITLVPPTEEDTHKGIVYLDPTNLDKKCTESDYTYELNKKTGCMKWYIFKDDGENYTMISAQNTTDKINGYSNAVGELNNLKTVSGWKVEPRLITADEVAEITGANLDSTIKWDSTKAYDGSHSANPNTNTSWFYFDGSGTTYSDTSGWHKQVANFSNKSKYAWLYDYTNSCLEQGCNIEQGENYGYWTSTAVAGSSSDVWLVRHFSFLYYFDVSDAYRGIRPVIEVSKSIVS